MYANSTVQPPAGYDINQPAPDRGHILVVWSFLLSSMAVFFVFLRLGTKACFYKALHLEDFFLFLALTFLLVFNNFTYMCKVYGMGRHVWDVRPEDVILLKKYFMPCIWSFAGAHWAVKLSFVAFYRRIYYKHMFTCVINSVYGFLIVTYGIFFVIHCLPCIPLRAYWDPTYMGKKFCFDPHWDYLMLGVLNLVADVIILLLPIPIVRQAKVKTGRKVMLAGVFGLGLFCAVTSLLRIVVSLDNFDGNPNDLSWNITTLMCWSMAETTVGVIVCCLLQLNRLGSWIYTKTRNLFFKPDESTDDSVNLNPKNTFFASGKKSGSGKNSRGNMTLDIENAMKSLATVQDRNEYGMTTITAGGGRSPDVKESYRTIDFIVETEMNDLEKESSTVASRSISRSS